MDTFKTNVQSGRIKTARELISQKIWNHRCYRQGMLVYLLRGLLVDSSSLIIYERSRNMIESMFGKQHH